MKESDMIPKRPYLLKAAFEWVADNAMTPYMLVNATLDKVVVPTQFVQDGQIVLNVSEAAVRHLHMDNDAVSFEARFGGKPMQVFVPMKAIMALYAKENGDGIFFPEEDFPTDPEKKALKTEAESNNPPEKKGPSLRVVK